MATKHKVIRTHIPKEAPKVITDPFAIADCLGGNITGNYQKDLKRAEKYNKTFTQIDYDYCYQLHEQP